MGKSISDIFSGGTQGGDQDIANAFNNAINSLPGYTNNAINSIKPWVDQGKDANTNYSDFVNNILKNGATNPGAWMNNYTDSPQAKYETKVALNASDNAAAGAGLLGGVGNRTDDMGIAQGIASKDMQNYFNNMITQQNQYTHGLSDLSHMGLTGAGQTADLWNDLGKNIISLITGQGAAQGAAHQAGTSGKNSAIGGALGGIGHALHWF